MLQASVADSLQETSAAPLFAPSVRVRRAGGRWVDDATVAANDNAGF